MSGREQHICFGKNAYHFSVFHLSNIARDGAAIVTLSAEKFDLTDASVQNYVAQLTDAIHFYGAKGSVALTQFHEPRGYNISDMTAPVYSGQRKYFIFGDSKEMPVDMIHRKSRYHRHGPGLYQRYGRKVYDGRGEDVVPCILCNRCHGVSSAPLLDVCSVNPKIGIAQKVNRMLSAPAVQRKVAVIGGGPAGLKAALVAVERGHKITLFEKRGVLGGQLRHAYFASFQWPLKDYKDYLIRQLKKAGVELFLNTAAPPG